jgi:prenyltransferase beta subunit
MMSMNQLMFDTIINTRSKLSGDAIQLIQQFISSCKHQNGGFIDKSGKQDIYYSVFGYTLSYVFQTEINYHNEKNYLNSIDQSKLDFVHLVSFIQCVFLIETFNFLNKNPKIGKIFLGSGFISNQLKNTINKKIAKEHVHLFKRIEDYRANDGGYNQNEINAKHSTIYANYLVSIYLKDFGLELDQNKISNIHKNRINKNGGFVNEFGSMSPVTTATSAALILQFISENSISKKSIEWLKNQQNKIGGFVAGEQLPLADLLSTSTAVLALNVTNNLNLINIQKCLQFIDLHWDKSGGFIGSISDSKPDIEYTFYALLGLGILIS